MVGTRNRIVAGSLLLAIALGGCGDNQIRRQLGLLHQGPDPFTALPNRAIVIPDTDVLPVPDPNALSPIQPDPIQTAREVLNIPEPPPGALSGAEMRLLAALGAEDADPGIRALIDSEARSDDDGTLLGSTPLVHRLFGIEQRRLRREFAIDPAAELERLREAGVVATPAGLVSDDSDP